MTAFVKLIENLKFEIVRMPENETIAITY